MSGMVGSQMGGIVVRREWRSARKDVGRWHQIEEGSMGCDVVLKHLALMPDIQSDLKKGIWKEKDPRSATWLELEFCSHFFSQHGLL
jgi:hypothetical protein